MRSRALAALVIAIDLAAVAALAMLPAIGLLRRPWGVVLLAAVAAFLGARPVGIPALRTRHIPTEPFVLCGLAAFGPLSAALISLAGVLGTTAARSSRSRTTRLAFNLGAVVLSTAAASGAFVLMGGTPGAGAARVMWPLAGAACAYFLVNTGLVAAAIAFDKAEGFLATWKTSFRWTAATCFFGFTLAVGLVLVLEGLGAWGLALGIPPAWLLASFYRAHKERVEEKLRRLDEVEALNGKLERTVRELKDALAHVRRLQGLLPICMHCKRIRDDGNSWHELEAYIAERSEASFSHSLCGECRSTHYPDVRQRREEEPHIRPANR